MNPIELDPKLLRWDAWCEFHTMMGPGYTRFGDKQSQAFTIFKTGEVVCTWSDFKPDDRHTYFELGIEVVNTNDQEALMLTRPDGSKVPKAWLNEGGSQDLIVDLATRHVVGVARHRNGEGPERMSELSMPERLRGHARVYWPKAFEPPVGQPIRLRHARKYTREEKKRADEIVESCKMWHRLLEAKQLSPYTKQMLHSISIDHSYKPLPITDKLLNAGFEELDEATRVYIVNKGLRPELVTEWEPYMVLA